MNIKRNIYDVFVNVICLGLLVGIIIYLGISWNSIPEKIPGHYNAAGVIDRWGNKGELLITPIIAWIMYIGLTAVEKFPQIWNTGVQITEQNKERVYRILKNFIGTEKVLIVAVFTFIMINSSLSKALPIWFLPVFLFLMFGTIILFILKLVNVQKAFSNH
jgi:F0F1-type ATP synthase assembly protein I